MDSTKITQETTQGHQSSQITFQNGIDDLLRKKQQELEERHGIYKNKLKADIEKKQIEIEQKSKELGFCEKHGEYNKYFTLLSGKLMGPIDCPKCAEEENEAKKIKEAERLRLDLISRRLEVSGIPKRYAGKSIADVDCNYHADENLRATANKTVKIISRYIDSFEERFERGTSGFLSGACGTGKTMIACIVVDSVIRLGHAAKYITAWSLIQDIRRAYNSDESIQSIVKKYVDIDFLVIDEIGVQGGTNDERVLLYQVIDGRYNEMKPSILISNSKDPVSDGYLDARTVDRLKENGGFSISFDGESYRCIK